MMEMMVRQAVSLQLIEVSAGTDMQQQPIEDNTLELVDEPEEDS